jgi:hypothetical protein
VARGIEAPRKLSGEVAARAAGAENGRFSKLDRKVFGVGWSGTLPNAAYELQTDRLHSVLLDAKYVKSREATTSQTSR